MRRKLEKYEIEEEIGHGGMATVYRARDTVLDRTVVLKVMHPHLRGAEEARRRFHREARSVARLRHPKVLEIYDFSGEGSPESYIAMEMLTGPTLKRWREERAEVPAEIAACIVIQVAEALEAAHAANIVHRDVKPENVLLHEDRTLKLTDFGIADMMDAISMTATGQILGSPGHMAPEQIEGRDSDTRTDLFSLGTVLYYLATGQLPFTGRNPHQVLKRIVDGEYADPLRVNPAIGGALHRIIVKCLERDLEARYQSASELREALEAFVAQVGIDEPEQTLADYLQDPEGVGETLKRRAIEALILRGSRASDAGDVPTALDCYNRVLALDEGNERVMKLIERVGVDRRRRGMLWAGAGLCAIGLLASGAAWALWTDEDAGAERPGEATLAQTRAEADAGLAAAEGVADAGRAGGDADARLDAGRDAGLDAGTDGGFDAGAPARRVARAPLAPRTRAVRFLPQPYNVRLAVDGEPLPGLQAELAVGRPHTVTVIPGDAIAAHYRSTNHTRTVPPGDEPWEWPVTADLEDAPLFVASSVRGAQVSVEGGRGGGPANRILYVRLRRRQEAPLVTVSAPGHLSFSARPTLTAGGETVRVNADLQRTGVAEAP